MNNFLAPVRSFIQDEEGSQVVEYALIIALVSIVLAVALGGAATGGGIQAAFTTLVGRLTTCFTAGTTTC
jgi:pilus assembly protein Flp/PilA